MPNPIKWSDLFDFADRAQVAAAIADITSLKTAYGDFKATVVDDTFKKLAQQQNDLTTSVRDLIKATNDLGIAEKQSQQNLLAAQQQMQQYDTAIKNLQATKKALKDLDDTAAASVNGLTKQLNEQIAAYNKLDSASNAERSQMVALADSIRQTRQELKKLTDDTQISAEKSKAAADSINGLKAKLNELREAYNNLSPKLDGKLMSKYADEIRKTEAALKSLNDQTKAIKPAAISPLLPDAGSLAGLTAKLKELKSAFSLLAPSDPAVLFQGYTLEIQKTQAAIDRLKNSLKIEPAKVTPLIPAGPAADSIDGLRAKLAGLEKDYNALSQSSKNYSLEAKRLIGDIKSTREEITNLTSATRQNVSSFSAAKNSYAALDAETKKLVIDLKNLENGMNGSNAKANALKAQIFSNTERLKAFDKEINSSIRNVGNYGSAFGGATSMLKSFALGLVSISALTAAVNKAFEESLRFDSLERALLVTSGSTQEFALDLQYLRETAERLGLEFDPLVRNFNKFIAASRIAGYSGEASRIVFEQFASAFSNLRLSSAETNSAFLAIEQIISKGKVSAEELRRQLGNVLPGAFELAAKAIGVTTTQLDKMLKSGEVISANFLPKFAAEVEKTFGVEQGKRVDSLLSSVNRFKNTVAELSQSPALRNFFATFVTGATNVVQFVRSIFVPAFETATKVFEDNRREIDEMENALSPLISRYDELKRSTTLSADEQSELRNVINELSLVVPGAATEFDKYGNALDVNRAKVIQFTDANRKLGETYRATALREGQDAIKQAMARGQQAQNVLNVGELDQTNPRTGIKQSVRTTFPAGNSKAGTFTPAGKEQYEILRESREAILKEAEKIVELGGKLDQSTVQFVGAFSAGRLQRVQEIAALTDKIRVKDLEAYTALKAGDDKSRKLRIAELEQLKKDLQEIQNPGSTLVKFPDAVADPNADKKAEAAERKRLAAAAKARKNADDLAKAGARLEIAEAEKKFARSEQYLKDEIQLEETRYAVVLKYANIRLKLYGKDSDEFKSIQAEKAGAEADMLERRAKAYDKFAKAQADQDQRLSERVQKDFKASADYYEQETSRQQQGEIDSVNIAVAKRSISVQRGRDLEHEIKTRYLRDEIEQQQYVVDHAEKQDAEFFNNKKALSQKLQALASENAAYEIAKAEEVAHAREELEAAAWSFVSELSNGFYAVQASNIDNEIAKLQQRYDIDSELAGDNKQAKENLDRQYQAKYNDLKRQEAQNQKDQSVFNIVLQTAEKVVSAFPNPYLMAAAAAIGAVQLGIVTAQKIPSYFVGRESGPAEVANVNEKGFELIRSRRTGKYRIAGDGGPTQTFLEAGDKVLTHQKSVQVAQKEFAGNEGTAAFMSSLYEGGTAVRRSEQRSRQQLALAIAQNSLNADSMETAFRKAVSDIPVEEHRFDDTGYNRFNRRRNTRVRILNERNRMGGKG